MRDFVKSVGIRVFFIYNYYKFKEDILIEIVYEFMIELLIYVYFLYKRMDLVLREFFLNLFIEINRFFECL